jgi:putative ABC transport system permease protein
VILLAGSGLLWRSFYRLNHVDAGFDAPHLLTMRFFLPRAGYPADRAVQLYEQMIERAGAVRGVRSAAAVSTFPFAGATPNVVFGLPSQPPPAPGRAPSADFASITPGYFETMGIRVIAGRSFAASDSAAAPFVAIVTQSMADKFFPGEEAIGQTIRILSNRPRTIVGIVTETRQRTFDAPPQPQIYLPHAQQPQGGMFLVVRASSTKPERLIPEVRAQIKSLDASLPIASVRTADQVMGGTLSARRFSLVLMTLFSAIALLLAVVGVYGALAFAVSQRRNEIGIRMALGARHTRVLTLMMWHGMWPVMAGLAIGIAGAVMATRVLASTLFEISPYDPVTLAAVTAVLVTTALAAAFFPARRAARIDPRSALQN